VEAPPVTLHRKIDVLRNMNSENFALAQGLVPASYIRQAQQARRSREMLLKTLLSQRRLPEQGWEEGTVKLILHELAMLDSNTFVGNAGVGEREGRIICPLVAQRHYGMGHGIGRSGDIAEAQPKAAGSSLIYTLTNALAADALRLAGAAVSECVVLPLATGMSVTLTLLALRQLHPDGQYVLWPRIDQKSCLKAVVAAGLTPIPIENELQGDELRTDLAALESKMKELDPSRVLCVLSTTSCFAPRGRERLLEVARLCDKMDIAHIANNAYGVQCAGCMKEIAAASRHARLDAFIQSTDKNFLVPVGGAIVASASAARGKPLLQKIRSVYPGRASMSPVLDLFCTLLHLGASGWLALLKERQELLPEFQRRLGELAAHHGERVLVTPHNRISTAVSLTLPPEGKAAAALGANLFIRLVSGVRVCSPSETPKKVCGLSFCSYGSHCEAYPTTYFAAACALGISRSDIDLFLKRLDKALVEWRRPAPSPKAAVSATAEAGPADGEQAKATKEQSRQQKSAQSSSGP